MTTGPKRKGDGWSRHRTIYFVSELSDERGGLLLANWVRVRGQEVDLHYKRLCGQLRCTPMQLERWIEQAVVSGFLSHGVRKGLPTLVRVGDFPRTEVPSAPEWSPAAPLLPPEEQVIAYIKRLWPDVPVRAGRVASEVGCSSPYARQLLRKLVNEGRLFLKVDGASRYYSVEPFPEPPLGAEVQGTSMQRRIIAALSRHGPLDRGSLAAALGFQFTRNALVGIKRLGVECTRIDGTAYWSVGPLPDAFRARKRDERRQRKLERDRARRRRAREGLSMEEEGVVGDALRDLAAFLFDHSHAGFRGSLCALREHCLSLAAYLERNDVVEVLRANRVVGADVNLQLASMHLLGVAGARRKAAEEEKLRAIQAQAAAEVAAYRAAGEIV
jgi:hypothetical protein